MTTPARRTGPYTPPTNPVAVTAVPALAPAAQTTGPIRIAAPVDTGPTPTVVGDDTIGLSVASLRTEADRRRNTLAEQVQAKRSEWEDCQAQLSSLRRQGQQITEHMNRLATELDPLVETHDRLLSTVRHFDAIIESTNGARR